MRAISFQITIIIIFQLVCNESTLTPKSPKSKKTEKVEDTPVGPQDETVFDKKLVIDPPSAKDILNNYNSYSVDRTTYRTQKSLGYVTPVSIVLILEYLIHNQKYFSGTIKVMMPHIFLLINLLT